MKKAWPILLALCIVIGVAVQLTGQPSAPPEAPRFTGDRLQRPANYREWVWLSSGLGMAYGPAASSNPNADPPFDNVFVTPAAYRSFLKTGLWPDQTIFVLEVRASQGKGSINQQGHYQGALRAMEVEVKDERR